MNFFFWLILGILTFNWALSLVLDWLNLRQWTDKLPQELQPYYDEEQYQRAQSYNRERSRFGLVSDTFSFVLTVLVVVFGWLGWLDAQVWEFTENHLVHALVFFAFLGAASEVVSLPFQLYSTFKIEEKWGFNKTDARTFWLDKLKGWLLSIVIGGVLLTLVLWLILELGSTFWLWAWLAMAAVILFANLFYTSLIVPLFNKLTPLEEGSLREKLEAYARKVDFPLQNVFVIDGSKRSTKANAFFSGLGKQKKVVLYDTLLENYTDDQLLAVIAHEVGHYKKKHIVSGLVLSLLQMGLMLFILGLFVFSPTLSQALGAEGWSLPVNLFAFGILYGPISLVLGLLGNILSRKNEFQADEYATQTASGEALQEGLAKLHTDHLANLRPHPAYVFFHYSHPPLLSRLQHIQEVEKR